MANAKRGQSILIALALVVLTVLAYLPVFKADFINYDDPDYVTSNPKVQAGLTIEGVKWAFTTGHASNWHPLTWMSHMLDWQLFEDNAVSHHATNLVLHVINAVLVFALLRTLTRTFWRSAFVAALFALHPTHVESVAWVAERKDVLSATFWFGTMLAYLKYSEYVDKGKSKAAASYILALFLFACGLMSKPMVVTLPFVLLLLDYWPLKRLMLPGGAMDENKGITPGRLFLEKVPFFLFSIISSCITFRVQKAGGAVTKIDVLPVLTRIENAFISYPRYIGKMFWPADLAVLYPHPWKWSLWAAILAAIFVIGISAIAVWQIKSRRYIAFGWFWFLGTLVPVIGVVQVGMQSIADRYTYIPYLGIFIIIAWGIAELSARFPGTKVAASISGSIIILACAGLTWKQAQFWKNSGTLFSHAVAVTDRNFLAHNNLGDYLSKQGDHENAIKHFQQALTIYPQFDLAWHSIAYSLANRGRLAEAIVHYERAIKLNPNNPGYFNNYGNALGSVGRDSDAIVQYFRAAELDAENEDAYNNLGVSLAMTGKVAEGIEHLHKAIRLNPRNPSAHSNLGNAYAVQGRTDDAIAEYEIALRLRPDDAQAHNNIANALSAKNRLDEAVQHYERAISLNSNNPEAHCNLGFVLARLGRVVEAKSHFVEALRLRPNYATAQQYLAALDAPSTAK